MNRNCDNMKDSCGHRRHAEVQEPRALPVDCANADERAGRKEKTLCRAFVIGSLLILALVAVVFYLKFASIGIAGNSPALEPKPSHAAETKI